MYNATPHTITLISEGRHYQIPPSGDPIRLDMPDRTSAGQATVEGRNFPVVYDTSFALGAVLDCAYKIGAASRSMGGTHVIVPLMVMQALRDWANDSVLRHQQQDAICFALRYSLSPDTSPDSVVRDDEGRIVGVRQLVCAP